MVSSGLLRRENLKSYSLSNINKSWQCTLGNHIKEAQGTNNKVLQNTLKTFAIYLFVTCLFNHAVSILYWEVKNVKTIK
jgi:hypothetical protein